VSRRSPETLRKSTFAALLAGLLAAAALTVALLPAAAASAAPAPVACGEPSAAPAQLTLHAMRTSVLCLMNRIRVHYHLDPLTYNQELRTSASAHSVSMVAHGYFAHEGPGGTMDGRVSRSGYLARSSAFRVGENIAAGDGVQGSPRAIVEDWMHSPPHRANMLDPSFHDAGVGVARGYPFGHSAGAATYTVDFGSRSSR
jgi:uncharacterized protein YkwD